MIMQTEMLYMRDCYLKEFEARVVQRGEDGGRHFVVLDKTAFYPLGGGQNSDTGTLNGIRVTSVQKDAGVVKHFTEAPVHETLVKGAIDWDKRHTFMRMHTAQHLLSAIVLDLWGSSTAGNQIELEYSRIDFTPLTPPTDFIDVLTTRFNQAVDSALPVKIYFTGREEVLKSVDERRRRLFARLPEAIKEIRIVDIDGVDKVPCGGTHVANTGEIGHMKITKVDNKGKDTIRVRFELEKPKV
ncbi:MAG: alanyl-tRNA editing protein [Candidatus Aenigmatarchaeota archaeon]